MITDTLRRIGYGHFMSQLDEASAQCAKAAKESGPATLTIKLTYKTTAAGVLNITGEHVAKMPKAQPLSALMWVLENGELVPNDPRQHDLPLQIVQPTTTQLQQLQQLQQTPESALLRAVVDPDTGEIRSA